MGKNQTIQLVEIPIGGTGGAVWNRLHEDREEICETLTRISGPNFDSKRELLQARLRKIDDALDRLMSGSFGICSHCGEPINDIELAKDPATSQCLKCAGSKTESTDPTTGVMLEKLDAFDTIMLQTHNSEYRIFLLDPKTGRALVEGGSYFLWPCEGLVKGSGLPGSAFNGGAIYEGGRLEIWVDEKVFLTSPVKSFEVKHHPEAESTSTITAALS